MDLPGRSLPLCAFVLLAASAARADDQFEQAIASGAEGFTCVEAQTETSVVPSYPRGIATEIAPADGAFIVTQGRGGLISIVVDNGVPRERARLSFGDDFVEHLALDGRGQAWVTGENFCIAVVDVSKAPELRLIGSWREVAPFGGCFPPPRALTIDGTTLWAAWQHHLTVYDVADPMHPSEVADIQMEFQETRSLRFVGGALVATFLRPLGGGAVAFVTRAYDVRDPAHPAQFPGEIEGRVLADGAQLYAISSAAAAGFSRLTIAIDQREMRLEPLGELPTRSWIGGVADDFVFANHNSRGLDLYSLPSLHLVGGILGNFETGFSDMVRYGDILATATRFGGTQFVDLRSLENLPPSTLRFPGQTIHRNRFHGDLLPFVVQPGDSIASLQKRHGLVDRAPTWAQRMEPIERINRGRIDDLDRLRPGQTVYLPLPRRLFCQPAARR